MGSPLSPLTGGGAVAHLHRHQVSCTYAQAGVSVNSAPATHQLASIALPHVLSVTRSHARSDLTIFIWYSLEAGIVYVCHVASQARSFADTARGLLVCIVLWTSFSQIGERQKGSAQSKTIGSASVR